MSSQDSLLPLRSFPGSAESVLKKRGASIGELLQLRSAQLCGLTPSYILKWTRQRPEN